MSWPILAIGLFLVCMPVGALFALRWQKAREAIESRLEVAIAPHRRASVRNIGGRSDGRAPSVPQVSTRVAALFGFDLARTAEYPVKWWVAVVVCLGGARVGAGLAVVVLGDSALFATPVLWVIMSRAFFSYCENARQMKLYRQFPDALAMIVRSVRIGIPVAEGLRTVAREAPEPTRGEFSRVADQVTIGVPVEDAMRDLAERSHLAEYRFFATALTLQSQTGGGLAETLENLAELIRKRVALRARAHALASEARTSAAVLASLPVVVGLALAALNPEYLGLLMTTELGSKLAVAALVSIGLGVAAMRGIIRRSLT